MGRVAHQKSVKQANPTNASRAAKAAKQRKNHKVVIESDAQDKEKSRAVLSFHADPPAGYTFIPAGNPQLTSALKEFAKKGGHQIFAVTTTPHAGRHELSREVHRIGFHFPTQVVAQVCNHYGIRLTSGGKLVEEQDDDKLFMKLYQKGQLVLDEKVRDQVTINTEAKQIIQDLFPNIPDNDLFQIIKTAFQLGNGKVGTADEIPLVRRAQLSVVAHIRHCYTNYDKLLKQFAYSEARHRVEDITLQKLIQWRGDEANNQVMDDTLREVVVISDEEISDDEVEEGQILPNEHLQVRPINGGPRPAARAGDRPQSPVDVNSDDDAPSGYRYLPQVARRYPVEDMQAVSVARQQSRYAVWDRARQQYRAGAAPEPSRIIERVLIDEPLAVPPQSSYAKREPVYISEPGPIRIVEPVARTIQQPAPPTYIRGVDGKLYERTDSHPGQMAAPVPLQRIHTPPPVEYRREYVNSRPASPRPPFLQSHRRNESYDYGNGTVLPSIEGRNSVYQSPTSRHNPFDDPQSRLSKRNSDHYTSNQQTQIIDLTSSAEQASKRRRMEETPPSPYLERQHERSQNGYMRQDTRADRPAQRIDNAYPYEQHQVVPLEAPPVTYDQEGFQSANTRVQPTVVYREQISNGIPSSQGIHVRPITTSDLRDTHYMQSPRRVEYRDLPPVNDYDRKTDHRYGELPRQYVSNHATNGIDDRRVYVEGPSHLDRQSHYGPEPAAGCVRSEARNPLERGPSQYHMQELPPDYTYREYDSMSLPHHSDIARDLRPLQLSSGVGSYQSPRMAAQPSTSYRNGSNLRTAYIQN